MYISERAQDLLKMEPTGEQALSIAIFGPSKGDAKVCPTVSVWLCHGGYPSMSLSLYVMPSMCEPFVGQPILTCVRQHPHLLGLELADFSNTALNMPIGLDYYWQLVTGSICRETSGHVAVHTKLGWVLSGPSSLDNNLQCSMSLSVTHILYSKAHSVQQCKFNDQHRSFREQEALGIQEEERMLVDDCQFRQV